ncbi:aminomethyl transferase family protein [Dehalobacter sp. DCM]|uniref:aminomethyl transferase family protein n=1 Tax=Dehalobacter sp. DCM TaxID=2907827 RepID=UPI0030817B39|nr:aminomethyl transferase family protein [Dehalobacter sp. DCM]
MSDVVNQGVFTLMSVGGMYTIPYEYTGYKDEILASKSTAWVGTALNESPIFDIKGPDAAEFLTSICVNDYRNMKVGGIRHAVICNEKGQMVADGVVMKIEENTFRTYWLMPVVDYYASISKMNIEGIDMTGKEFFVQIAGPKSLEILEKASQSDLHDIKFAQHRIAKIAGHDVRILRLGMAGTLAYEFHGDMAALDEVYERVWEIAALDYDAKKLGRVAYCMNHTEAGYANLNMHYPLPWYEDPGIAKYLEDKPMAGFFNANRKLIGSVGDDLEIRFKTPYDVDWGFLVKFNHEFPGRKALEEIAKNPKTQMVTLEWNPDDLGEIFASQFRGQDVEPYDTMDDRPMDMYYNCGFSFAYHADKVMDGDKMVGTSAGRLNSVYYRRMISLGFIDKEYAVEGKELTVIWGTPGTPQKAIRVRVARTPYMNLENNKEIDVETIPCYQG